MGGAPLEMSQGVLWGNLVANACILCGFFMKGDRSRAIYTL